MQTYQASLHYTLVRLGDHDRLGKPLTFVDYMAGAFEDCASQESLWLISMNPKWRPIARTLVKTGPLVATMTSPRELFRVALRRFRERSASKTAILLVEAALLTEP